MNLQLYYSKLYENLLGGVIVLTEYSKELLTYFYRTMWRIRLFEETVEKLFLKWRNSRFRPLVYW